MTTDLALLFIHIANCHACFITPHSQSARRPTRFVERWLWCWLEWLKVYTLVCPPRVTPGRSMLLRSQRRRRQRNQNCSLCSLYSVHKNSVRQQSIPFWRGFSSALPKSLYVTKTLSLVFALLVLIVFIGWIVGRRNVFLFCPKSKLLLIQKHSLSCLFSLKILDIG
jgi:hypothetical protein